MRERNQKLVNEFNEKYPVGTSVKLEYSGDIVDTKVKQPAYIFQYNGIPVAFFENIGGVVDIRKVIEEE